MEILTILNAALEILGKIVVGYWIVSFIFHCYVKGESVKELPRHRSNKWEYM